PSRLAAGRERLRQERLDLLAVGEAFSQLVGPGGELGVGEGLHGGLERVDVRDDGPHPLDVALVLGAEDRPEDRRQHVKSSSYQIPPGPRSRPGRLRAGQAGPAARAALSSSRAWRRETSVSRSPPSIRATSSTRPASSRARTVVRVTPRTARFSTHTW